MTGGCRGVGRGIAERYLAARADVVTCCRREPESPQASGDHVAGSFAADVRDPDEIDRVIAFMLERHGRLDVLVNNAGGSPPADSATASPRFSTAIITLDLVAPLMCSQKASVVMQEQPDGGCIVNIAGVSGLRPSPGTAAYGAAKAGLINLTEIARMLGVTDKHGRASRPAVARKPQVCSGRIPTPGARLSAPKRSAAHVASPATGALLRVYEGQPLPAGATPGTAAVRGSPE